MVCGHCREESAQLRTAERETQPGEAHLDICRRRTLKGVNGPHRCHLPLWRRPASLSIHPHPPFPHPALETRPRCPSATAPLIVHLHTPLTTVGRRVRNTALRPHNRVIMAMPLPLLDMLPRLRPGMGHPRHLAHLPGPIPSCGSGSLLSTLIARERLVLRNSRPLW